MNVTTNGEVDFSNNTINLSVLDTSIAMGVFAPGHYLFEMSLSGYVIVADDSEVEGNPLDLILGETVMPIFIDQDSLSIKHGFFTTASEPITIKFVNFVKIEYVNINYGLIIESIMIKQMAL